MSEIINSSRFSKKSRPLASNPASQKASLARKAKTVDAKQKPPTSRGKTGKGELVAAKEITLSSIRELAWTGQHAPAIDLATQALSMPKIKPATQINLLDLRAESYIAIGKLDLAMQDAKAMMKIGRTSKVKGLQVQALNTLALVQMRTGDLKVAVKSATTAVKTKHSSPALRAESLFRLSEAQWRIQDNEPALKNAQQAIDLFQAAGDNSGAGRAYWSLGNAYYNLNRSEDLSRCASMGLELCQQAGDQYGIGNSITCCL